ncbi:DUF397 domain-containing protein [Actinokineospora sp.]|uniref:DUF397 domain-containing protein n=1 Tax=Actinokineospora sp. TaxID=1872133 RepID=UPI00403813D2
MRYEDAAAALATATNWHKSTYSDAANGCVEVGSALATAKNWHKSTYSNGANACVEVGSIHTVVGVRDTKLAPASPILAFAPQAWAAFTTTVREH